MSMVMYIFYYYIILSFLDNISQVDETHKSYRMEDTFKINFQHTIKTKNFLIYKQVWFIQSMCLMLLDGGLFHFLMSGSLSVLQLTLVFKMSSKIKMVSMIKMASFFFFLKKRISAQSNTKNFDVVRQHIRNSVTITYIIFSTQVTNWFSL